MFTHVQVDGSLVFVIPVKTGIHFLEVKENVLGWIPASAGMTKD